MVLDVRNESAGQSVPLRPRLLRPMPDVPLVNVADRAVSGVFSSIGAAPVVVNI